MVPAAFKIAAQAPSDAERRVRLECREMFKQTRLLKRIIPMIEQVLAAGEISPPPPHEEAVPIAIPNPETLGDGGHRG